MAIEKKEWEVVICLMDRGVPINERSMKISRGFHGIDKTMPLSHLIAIDAPDEICKKAVALGMRLGEENDVGLSLEEVMKNAHLTEKFKMLCTFKEREVLRSKSRRSDGPSESMGI